MGLNFSHCLAHQLTRRNLSIHDRLNQIKESQQKSCQDVLEQLSYHRSSIHAISKYITKLEHDLIRHTTQVNTDLQKLSLGLAEETQQRQAYQHQHATLHSKVEQLHHHINHLSQPIELSSDDIVEIVTSVIENPENNLRYFPDIIEKDLYRIMVRVCLRVLTAQHQAKTTLVTKA